MLRHVMLLAGVLAIPSVAAGAEAGDFLSGGKAAFELRYRLETVEQDGFADKARASTLRGRMTLTSGTVAGFSGVLETDGLAAIFSEDFNSTRNGKTQYPQVVDPRGLDLNQLYLQYAGLPQTVVKLGRQRLRLDTERFIGAVGWRQNEQTFNALSIENKSIARTTISYAFIDQVRRIFGPYAGTPPATLDGGAHVFNARVAAWPVVNVTVYDYYLDFSNQPQLSSNTYGLRLDGSRRFNDQVVLSYAVEFARQAEAGDSLAEVDADYRLVELGGKVGPVGVTFGQEVLGGERGTFAASRNPAFQTPLATLHRFQGWADKFLTTPSAGIDDRYVGVSATLAGFNGQVAWHDYSAEATSQEYGTELDLSVSRRFAKRYDVLVKYASYSTDGLYTDTDKFWVQVTAAF